ncbi:MAG TPA: pyruvate kinase [Candidatus Krumholzibacteriaceae bacterium]|nr:pyruvate kinase [Candidatus Krumholzibacteriaceae bacterium]
MKNFLSTKIIATVGPGSAGKIKELISSGVRVFRINSSHGNQREHSINIQNIRQISEELNLFIPIIIDLQGPKIRIGNLNEPVNLKEGEKIILKPCAEQAEPGVIPVNYEEITQKLEAGSTILLDDGKIELKVTDPKKIEALVIAGGILTSRKGLNIPGATTSFPSVTEKDIEYIKFAVEKKIDFIALSFVRSAKDIEKAREHISKAGGNIPIIAKIEKPQAVENLTEIMLASDSIMVARGDLGIEISPERVPIIQKHLIREANSYKKAVITATQMLESMIGNPIPTRAEASDVANAIIDGTDAVMLSGETAVGNYPVQAVKIMKSIAENVEKSNLCKYNVYESEAVESSNIDSQTIVSATIRMLGEVGINAIVAFTRSGFTAGLLSKAKPSVPVVAISDSKEVCLKLNLLWGVLPFYMEFSPSLTEEFLRKTDQFLVAETFLEKGDKIVITGGMPHLSSGTTNFIRLHQIGSL